MVLGGRHWVLVAGLVVELSLNQVVSDGRDKAGLNGEVAGVDAQFGLRVRGQRDVNAGGVTGHGKLDACAIRNRKRCGNEIVVVWACGS